MSRYRPHAAPGNSIAVSDLPAGVKPALDAAAVKFGTSLSEVVRLGLRFLADNEHLFFGILHKSGAEPVKKGRPKRRLYADLKRDIPIRSAEEIRAQDAVCRSINGGRIPHFGGCAYPNCKCSA